MALDDDSCLLLHPDDFEVSATFAKERADANDASIITRTTIGAGKKDKGKGRVKAKAEVSALASSAEWAPIKRAVDVLREHAEAAKRPSAWWFMLARGSLSLSGDRLSHAIELAISTGKNANGITKTADMLRASDYDVGQIRGAVQNAAEAVLGTHVERGGELAAAAPAQFSTSATIRAATRAAEEATATAPSEAIGQTELFTQVAEARERAEAASSAASARREDPTMSGYKFDELVGIMTEVPHRHPAVLERPEPYGVRVAPWVAAVMDESDDDGDLKLLIMNGRWAKWSQLVAEIENHMEKRDDAAASIEKQAVS